MSIRFAVNSDLPAMVKLAEQQHLLDEGQQPMLWRKAKDSTQHQLEYYEHYLQQEHILMMVSQKGNGVNGFVIARIENPPKIYNVPGYTCLIDDFIVEAPKLWQSVGISLLNAVTLAAKNKKAVQIVIVSHAHERHKQLFLSEMGLSVAAQWYTKTIE